MEVSQSIHSGVQSFPRCTCQSCRTSSHKIRVGIRDGEEVRKAKAQLELRLPTEVKENKKSFYKYINGKRRSKESFHPLLDAAGNMTTEDKLRSSMHSLYLPLIVRSVIFRALYALIWKSGIICRIHPQ